MAKTDAGWEMYRSFLGVVRHGSLSAAARVLGLTQPTLGRHIDALETALGITLFMRSQHGLMPTQAALGLAPHAEAMAAAADALARASTGEAGALRGTVRLTASEIVGVEILPPMLTDFRAAHPNIDIELSLSNRNQDLLRRDADIAVRMIAPVQKALVARKLGKLAVGLFAHRRYLAGHGMPPSLGALSGHTLIGFDADAGAIGAMRQTGLPITRDLFALRTDSDHAQLAHLRAGFGIGGCQLGIAAREADLVPVLAEEFRFDLEVWLVSHAALRGSRRVRLLYDHLARALRTYIAAAATAKPGRSGGGQGGSDVLYPRTLRLGGRKKR
ncbi:MAG: LysR family transcriptional regulator [Alphaproteobacteria bacterium]|nr:LysR family transcriptional regulator [Alphaproteobacteria bacterium]MDE2495848.1 LysR family transcriptional regulator [Alphaproteobacteria bacterium]